MAEALAVVASGVGVASFALQLVDCAIKLRRLWADIKDAPEHVINLIGEIHTLSHVLETINATHTPVTGNAMFDQCYVFCVQGVRNVESVAKDLEMFVRQKRPGGALRVVLKKDVIAKHVSQLETCENFLAIGTANISNQLQKVDAILATQGQILLQPVQLLSQSSTTAHIQFSGIEAVPEPSPPDRDKYPSDRTLSVRRRSHTYPKRKKDRLSLRTPTWLTGRVWDVRVREACSGWTLGVSTYNVRPENASVFRCVHEGDLQSLQQLFDKGEASPFDRDPHGETLLHYAAVWDRVEIYRFLLDQGADSKTEDFDRITPLQFAFICGTFGDRRSVDIHRLLLTEGETDELIDSESVVRLLSRGPFLRISPAAMKRLQQTICFLWASIDFKDRVMLTTRSRPGVELLKLILGPGSLPKEAFEFRFTSSRFNPNESLFPHLAWGVGDCCGQKGDETLWETVLREAVSVNGHLCSSEWDRSPLVEFLNGSKLRHINAGSQEPPYRRWLQSLQRAGADLVEYGQLESRNLKSPKIWHAIDVKYGLPRHAKTYFYRDQVRIINLTYGPEPEDWHIWFSWPLDEWAGDFWLVVENPELFKTPEQFDIPGAWLPDKSEERDWPDWELEDEEDWRHMVFSE